MGKIMSPTDRDDEHEKSRTATLKQWVETQASVLTWERCKMQRFSSQAFLATWVQGKTCQNILNHWGIYISGNMLGICCPADYHDCSFFCFRCCKLGQWWLKRAVAKARPFRLLSYCRVLASAAFFNRPYLLTYTRGTWGNQLSYGTATDTPIKHQVFCLFLADNDQCKSQTLTFCIMIIKPTLFYHMVKHNQKM